jgi:RecA-family ATPase
MMVAIPKLQKPVAANDNKVKLPASFVSMVREKAATEQAAVISRIVSDDSIDAETLLGMEFPPLEYVIPGYVVEGLTVLAGKPKLGKSWWAYDASIAVATGGKAMGAIDCEQGDVLYLALEDNRRRVQDRLLTLCPARKVQNINLKRLTVRTVAPRIDTGLLPQLDKWRLSCERPRLIIIDVFLKVRPPRKKGEDPYSADYDAVTPLQRYAGEHRLAIVLVTHTRKMAADDPLEAVSGTNGVTGAADAVLVLDRGTKGTTLYGRGRDIEEIETAMRFDGGRWGILGDADEVRKSDERRKIVTALKEAGDEIGPKAIADLTGMKSDNVRRLLRKMVASGEIHQPRVGFYSVPFSKPPS